MTWRDAAALAVKGVSRRLGRAVLTMLGVALAAALLTALLTIADTARTRILSQLSRGGPLASIRVTDGSSGPLDDRAVHSIARLPDVSSVVPVMTVTELIVPPDPPVWSGSSAVAFRTGGDAAGAGVPYLDTVVGTDLSRPQQLPVTVLAGRLPAADSRTEVAVTLDYLDRLGLSRNRPVAVLGTELEMGAPQALSSSGIDALRSRWTRAVIAGVVAQDADNGAILAPMAMTRAARNFSGDSENGSTLISQSVYSSLLVSAKGLDQVAPVRLRLSSMGYSTTASDNLIASVQRYLHVVEIVLAGIGLIALVISALGIASALFAAIRERRREIGVLKAIGARDRDVLRVILIEAGVLGFAGGVAGVGAGWLIARTVGLAVNRYLAKEGLAGVHMGLPVPIAVGGLVGSVLLALVAGSAPAVRAARLPAREAVNAG